MHDRHVWLVGACALLSVIYILPSLIGVVRHGAESLRLVLINLLLGWTLVGWAWALALACRRPRVRTTPAVAAPDWTPWLPGRPEAPAPTYAAPDCYADGTYLISERGAARTWAICGAGRWGIAYELDGIQRTGAWVDSSDIPVAVLAYALDRCPATRERS
jgi:hypothetical protein